VLQRPARANVVGDVFRPDPTRPVRVFGGAETARRRQPTGQVIEPPGLIGVHLALVIVPGRQIIAINLRVQHLQDERPRYGLALVARPARETMDSRPCADAAGQLFTVPTGELDRVAVQSALHNRRQCHRIDRCQLRCLWFGCGFRLFAHAATSQRISAKRSHPSDVVWGCSRGRHALISSNCTQYSKRYSPVNDPGSG
jgi:hypothetical protein